MTSNWTQPYLFDTIELNPTTERTLPWEQELTSTSRLTLA
jgi:hypothetical protein